MVQRKVLVVPSSYLALTKVRTVFYIYIRLREKAAKSANYDF